MRGKNYDWGLGEFAFVMYSTAANLGLLLANNFVLAILGDAYSNQVRAWDSNRVWTTVVGCGVAQQTE